MPIDPKESRKAHSQNGGAFPTAGSVPPQEFQGSSTRGAPAQDPVRAGDLGQPFPLAPRGVVGDPIRPRHFSKRSAKPISPLLLSQVLDRKPAKLIERMAANDRALREHNRQAMGGRLGFAIFVFGLVIAVASVGGLLR